MGLIIFGAIVLMGAIAIIIFSLRRNVQGEEDDPQVEERLHAAIVAIGRGKRNELTIVNREPTAKSYRQSAGTFSSFPTIFCTRLWWRP